MQFHVFLTYLECWNMMTASHDNKCRSVPTVHFKPCLVSTTYLEMTQHLWFGFWFETQRSTCLLLELIRGHCGRCYRLWNDLLIINLKSMKKINRRWSCWFFYECVCPSGYKNTYVLQHISGRVRIQPGGVGSLLLSWWFQRLNSYS